MTFSQKIRCFFSFPHFCGIDSFKSRTHKKNEVFFYKTFQLKAVLFAVRTIFGQDGFAGSEE